MVLWKYRTRALVLLCAAACIAVYALQVFNTRSDLLQKSSEGRSERGNTARSDISSDQDAQPAPPRQASQQRHHEGQPEQQQQQTSLDIPNYLRLKPQVPPSPDKTHPHETGTGPGSNGPLQARSATSSDVAKDARARVPNNDLVSEGQAGSRRLLDHIMFAVISGGSNETLKRSLKYKHIDENAHKMRYDNRQAVLDTWATEHTYFVTREPVNSDKLIVLDQKWETTGREGLPLKVREMWREMYLRYGDKYDFFMKGDDDTFIHTARLERILKRFNPEVPFMMGRRVGGLTGFCHGGSGYILSRALLQLVGPHLRSCYEGKSRGWEDLWMKNCVSQTAGYGTTDVWLSCTDMSDHGFDGVFQNSKDQKRNQKEMERLYAQSPSAAAMQVTFHSAYTELAHKLNGILNQLDQHAEVVQQLEDTSDRLLKAWPENVVAGWKCNATLKQQPLQFREVGGSGVDLSSTFKQQPRQQAVVQAICQQSALLHPRMYAPDVESDPFWRGLKRPAVSVHDASDDQRRTAQGHDAGSTVIAETRSYARMSQPQEEEAAKQDGHQRFTESLLLHQTRALLLIIITRQHLDYDDLPQALDLLLSSYRTSGGSGPAVVFLDTKDEEHARALTDIVRNYDDVSMVRPFDEHAPSGTLTEDPVTSALLLAAHHLRDNATIDWLGGMAQSPVVAVGPFALFQSNPVASLHDALRHHDIVLTFSPPVSRQQAQSAASRAAQAPASAEQKGPSFLGGELIQQGAQRFFQYTGEDADEEGDDDDPSPGNDDGSENENAKRRQKLSRETARMRQNQRTSFDKAHADFNDWYVDAEGTPRDDLLGPSTGRDTCGAAWRRLAIRADPLLVVAQSLSSYQRYLGIFAKQLKSCQDLKSTWDLVMRQQPESKDTPVPRCDAGIIINSLVWKRHLGALSNVLIIDSWSGPSLSFDQDSSYAFFHKQLLEETGQVFFTNGRGTLVDVVHNYHRLFNMYQSPTAELDRSTEQDDEQTVGPIALLVPKPRTTLMERGPGVSAFEVRTASLGEVKDPAVQEFLAISRAPVTSCGTVGDLESALQRFSDQWKALVHLSPEQQPVERVASLRLHNTETHVLSGILQRFAARHAKRIIYTRHQNIEPGVLPVGYLEDAKRMPHWRHAFDMSAHMLSWYRVEGGYSAINDFYSYVLGPNYRLVTAMYDPVTHYCHLARRRVPIDPSHRRKAVEVYIKQLKVQNPISRMLGITNKKQLDDFVENFLPKMALFLLGDRWTESLVIMRRLFNWDIMDITWTPFEWNLPQHHEGLKAEPDPHERPPLSAYELSDNMLRTVRNRTALDQELYDAVVRQFERVKQRVYDETFDQEVKLMGDIEQTMIQACRKDCKSHPLCQWYGTNPFLLINSCGYSNNLELRPKEGGAGKT